MTATAIAINPGSGDAGAYGRVRRPSAIRNICAFVDELGINGVTWSLKGEDPDDGRYRFLLRRGNGKRCVVEMPGLVLEKVRYRTNTTDNAWHFPRLLIGQWGSSWLWPFAVSNARRELQYAFEVPRDER